MSALSIQHFAVDLKSTLNIFHLHCNIVNLIQNQMVSLNNLIVETYYFQNKNVFCRHSKMNQDF